MISTPSISRLCKKAGVKTINKSGDCPDLIRNTMLLKMTEVLNCSVILCQMKQNKTVMEEDVYDALRLCGYNFTASEYISMKKHVI
mgnify:CR=1 FL=1